MITSNGWDSCRCDDADGWHTVTGCEYSTVSFTKVSDSSEHSFTCSQRGHKFVSVHNWHNPATALNQTALTKPTTARRGSFHIGGSKSDTYAHAGETQMRSAYISWFFLTETGRWHRFYLLVSVDKNVYLCGGGMCPSSIGCTYRGGVRLDGCILCQGSCAVGMLCLYWREQKIMIHVSEVSW